LLMQEMPQPSTDEIARRGRTDDAADRKCHLRWRDQWIEYVCAPQRSGSDARAAPGQSPECGPPVQAADQADRRWRPLSRRDLRMARPARVLIRARKPCFLARWRLFG